MLWSMLYGDECPDKGYECSVKDFTYYKTSPDTVNDLMDQFDIPHKPWADKNGEATYHYGMGHATMIPHPDLAAPVMVLHSFR